MTDKPTVSLDDLKAIVAAEGKRTGVDEDRLQEYAVAALSTLRGLTRTDKLKVIRRMRKMLRP